MNVFIIEDEYLGLQRLCKLLSEVDNNIVVLGHSESIKSTVQWLQNNPAPDLVFMDIELADGQCFEIFKQVEVKSPIVFTTSYDEYALQAFKVNSVDYLLKPIKKEELEAALSKFQRMREQFQSPAPQMDIEKLVQELRQSQQPKAYRKRFLLKQGQRWLSVEVPEIAWFMADGKLCFLKTWDNRRLLVDYTLEELGEMLDPAEFCRVNRSYIVHVKAIKSIDTYFGGKLILQLSPKTEANDVVVSKEKATDFKQWMGR
ncbi:MAG: LytR/AlgR family response regulator transcription factor [Saprospiraceae bacterium]